jgi:Ca2+-transporting ATPase
MRRRVSIPHAMNPTVDAYLSSTDEIARQTATDARAGLSRAESAARLQRHGPNAIQEGERRGPLAMLARQFTDFTILVLIAAALVSGLLGDVADTLVIIAIVVLNAAVGFIQEYRAERAVAALKAMAAPAATVVRDGQALTIAADELVPGDLVLLAAGNIVPADLRLFEAQRLKVDEAALTGESHAVDKHTQALHEQNLPLGDRRNMAYKGTIVTYGRGQGVVVATGMQTEFGRVAELLHEGADVQTPLQKRLARFGRVIAASVIGLCAAMFSIGVLRGQPVMLMLLTAISLAVAAIPEALPAVVTIALALGARRMVKRKALVRRLPAVETLGSVTFICSDKTGTLTENRMRVQEYYAEGRPLRWGEAVPVSAHWSMLHRALALSNDARASAGAVVGDPTEVALYEAAADAGCRKEDLAGEFPRLAELPFDSDRARMTTLHGTHDGVIAFTKGAPERLLPLCDGAVDQAAIQAIVERMAADGLRVLAVAMRRFAELPSPLREDEVERELSFIGLVGLLDPPRAEAREAVSLCQTAGITPVMITGDHPATARAIATQLGIIREGDPVVSGQELERLSLAELETRVKEVRVYARVAPAQKIKIVRALQDQGEFVAMTGDGVNDAPALKRADIGIAMGITGTDVAKEAAHMILLDDNFATIVAAVREGRRIYDNIRKFIRYVMTGNLGEIITLFVAPLCGLPIPLLPIHILWVNLVTDGLPGLALAAERAESGIMRRPPRRPGESVFAHGMWQHVIWAGVLIGVLCLLTMVWARNEAGAQGGEAQAQTRVFTVLTLAQMFHALAIRSERESLFVQGLFSNLPMLGAVVLTFVLQLALIYVPAFNGIFRTQPLAAGELGACVLIASTVFFAVEVEKVCVRRGWLHAATRASIS